MCLPIIGAAIGAVGTLASASAQSQSYKAQAQFQNRQAAMEQQKGAFEGSRLKDQHDRQLATMRGQFLSSGIALDGSAAEVLQDSASEASLDEQAIKYNARVNSDNLNWSAKLSRMNASNAMTGGALGALSNMVDGVTKIVNPYAAFGRG